jgi:hypothetical protein
MGKGKIRREKNNKYTKVQGKEDKSNEKNERVKETKYTLALSHC